MKKKLTSCSTGRLNSIGSTIEKKREGIYALPKFRSLNQLSLIEKMLADLECLSTILGDAPRGLLRVPSSGSSPYFYSDVPLMAYTFININSSIEKVLDPIALDVQRPIRLADFVCGKVFIAVDNAHDLDNADMHSGRLKFAIEHECERAECRLAD